MRTLKNLLLLSGLVVVTSCDKIDDFIGGGDDDDQPTGTIFENKSNLEPLVAITPQFNFVQAYSLISSSDVLDDGFRFVGAADGAGLVKDPNSDGFIYMLNAEDDYAVARIELDANLTPTGGQWVLNSGVADFARQCSGTMLRKDVHGGSRDIYLSASESFNYDVKGLDPYQTSPTPTADFGLDALGEFQWENAVPLPMSAYIGETVIIGGDDDSSNSLGQITLYHSTHGEADLEGGEIYVMKITEMSDGNGGVVSAPVDMIVDESMLDFGVTYRYEFVKIENGAALTKDEMEDACIAVGASAFMRVEDVDYRKGNAANNRQVFVAVTGRGPGRDTFNDWGTAYRMDMDTDSALTGSITQIISGNTDTNNMDGNLPELQSPDNITVTENFIYLQEDPNSFSRGHNAYIYQTDLNGNNARVVLEFVTRQDLDPTGSSGPSGEYGALEDISDLVGVPNTFLLNLQPHYWESDDFKGVDGHDFETRPEFAAGRGREDDQGGQVVILRGLPR
ncbi:hypothetical protein ACOKFD_02475 [Flagellimonas sp. S174]|uniref:hypothetical protein n=1 Tax=Flagellimonas sp. S174 TaxID=3410790 RepID=UPI003BF48084